MKSVTTCSHSCVQTIYAEDNVLLFIIFKAILKLLIIFCFQTFLALVFLTKYNFKSAVFLGDCQNRVPSYIVEFV